MKRIGPETALLRQVLDYAALRGWLRAHFRPGRVMRKGVMKYETAVDGDGKGFPDLILCRNSRLVVAELKSDTGSMTQEQRVWLAAFREAGAETYLWRPLNWPLIEEVLL